MITKSQFQNLVRQILTEEISKRVPEMNANGIDPEKKNKTFASDSNPRDSKTKEEMLDQITKAVNGVDKTWSVVWDDHDDISINGGDKLRVWITPLWEDNFKIVFMPRLEDRYFFTGLTWTQVLDFVKGNLSQTHHTAVEKARDKSWRNNEAKPQPADKGIPQQNKSKVLSTDNPFPKEKNKEKNYSEDQVKNKEDLPDQPMKEVGSFKRLSSYKVSSPVTQKKRVAKNKMNFKPL